MRLSELQDKNVVNVIDGRMLGNIVDLKIDNTNGNMIALVVELTGFFKRLFRQKETYEITWGQIEKIGEDVILVKMAAIEKEISLE